MKVRLWSVLLLVAAAGPAIAQGAGPAQTQQQFDQVAAADQALFSAFDGIKGTCDRQKTGEDYRARRELVPGTLEVYPLNNYGAIETGVHKFYQLLPRKPEKLVEVSQFTHVWKKEDGVWKRAR